jgi:hypothetical protein
MPKAENASSGPAAVSVKRPVDPQRPGFAIIDALNGHYVGRRHDRVRIGASLGSVIEAADDGLAPRLDAHQHGQVHGAREGAFAGLEWCAGDDLLHRADRRLQVLR